MKKTTVPLFTPFPGLSIMTPGVTKEPKKPKEPKGPKGPKTFKSPPKQPGLGQDEVLARLQVWSQHQESLTLQLDAFLALTGAEPDSKLLKPIYALWDAYTKEISCTVGDQEQWLDWYEYQCNMGRTPSSVEFGPQDDNKVVLVDSLERLTEVICT